jgi:hypothetical protein
MIRIRAVLMEVTTLDITIEENPAKLLSARSIVCDLEP